MNGTAYYSTFGTADDIAAAISRTGTPAYASLTPPDAPDPWTIHVDGALFGDLEPDATVEYVVEGGRFLGTVVLWKTQRRMPRYDTYTPDGRVHSIGDDTLEEAVDELREAAGLAPVSALACLLDAAPGGHSRRAA